MKWILSLILCLCLFGCQKPSSLTVQSLETQGITYEEIEPVPLDGYDTSLIEKMYKIEKDGQEAYFLDEGEGYGLFCTPKTYKTFLKPYLGDDGLERIAFYLDDKNVTDGTAVSIVSYKKYEIFIHHECNYLILRG